MAAGITRENEQATAEALIEAGRELFARQGYDGASVRAITARAGANLGAITYHFGSKRALYDRVVESSVLPLVEQVEAVAAAGGAPLERVGEVVRRWFRHLTDHPELPRLMLQEFAVGRMPPVAAIGPMRRMLAALVRLVREGQEDGSIRQGDPRLLGLGTISQSLHLSLMREPLKVLMDLDLDEPERHVEAVNALAEYACRGLAAHLDGIGQPSPAGDDSTQRQGGDPRRREGE